MPPKTDPLKAFRLPNRKMPMRSGQGKMKSNETPQGFVKRIMDKQPRCPEPFPVVILAVEGNIELAAMYYGTDTDFLKGVCEMHKPSAEAWQKARAAKFAEEKKGREVGDALRKQAMDEVARLPDLPERKNWPRDEVERVRAYRAWLVDEKALRLYEGDLVRVSEGGTIPLDVLVELVDGDEQLEGEMEIGLKMAAIRAQSRLGHLSRTSNQPTAALRYIEAFGDQRFRPKSQVDVRKVGFEPPSEKDDELESVLTLKVVDGGK